MRSEKSKKGSKNNKAKRNVQTVKKAPGRHSKEEIISKEELEKAIETYNHRDRRYGGVKEEEEQNV